MSNGDPPSSSTVTATGEFQRKEVHAMGTVEINNGVIQSVSLALSDGGEPQPVDDVVAILVGRQVSEALAVQADSAHFDAEKSGLEAIEVLLEAFHRAVETCLDRQ